MARDFRQFFYFVKKLYLGPILTGKSGFTKLFVFPKIFAKNVCAELLTTQTPSQRSQQERLHMVNSFTFEKRNNDKSEIACPRSRLLRGHGFFELCRSWAW